MAKYSFFLTLLSCLIFGSCQTIEQISIDYMMPAEINFPPELRRVAIVNNVSAIPDNKWIEAEKPISGNEVARAIAYTHGDAGIATESLARAIADGNYFDEVVICDSALLADSFGKPAIESHKIYSLSCRLAMLLWYYRPAGTANGKNLRSEPDTPHANYHSE